MSGILETLSWFEHQGKRVCKTTLIPLKNVLYVTDHSDGTCLIAVTEHRAIHADIPFKQMKKILKEHYKNPNKDFDTHPDLEDETPKEKSGGGGHHGKK